MFQTTNQLQCVPVNIATSMFVCWNRYSWQCRGVLYPRSRPEFKHSEPFVSSLNMHSKSFKHEMPCSNSRASNKTNKTNMSSKSWIFSGHQFDGWKIHRILVQCGFPSQTVRGFPSHISWNLRWSKGEGWGKKISHAGTLTPYKNHVFVSITPCIIAAIPSSGCPWS